MTQRKKSVSFVLLLGLAALMLFGGAISAYAQPYQIVTLSSTPEPVAQGGTVDVTFTYNTSDNRDDLTGFGAIFCFDSSALVYQSYTGIKAETLLAAAIKVYDDTNDQCGFGATGKKIPLVYKEKDGVKLTSAGLPADLVKFTFQAANTDTTTTVKSIGTIKAAGYEIQDDTATITIGVVKPVITPMDIPTAVLAIEAGDTVIDANTADYANQHIAGAITADAVPADKATRILVYCRDVAAAQAQAQALADLGYTNVGYLNVPFADFAADTTNVTDAMVQYKLTVNTVGVGAVTGNSADGFQNRNAVVTLVATPTTVTWTGDTTDGTVTMTGVKTVTATFAGAVNIPPVADAASYEVVVGSMLSKTLTGDDPDKNFPLTFIVDDKSVKGVPVGSDPNTGEFNYEPTTVGTDTFTFKVKDSEGAESTSATVTITVKPVPACTASFTIAPNPANVGENVTFDASASTANGNIISYAWTFTDPSGANAGNPGGVTTSKPFNTPGVYTATLKITDDQGCSNTSAVQSFEVKDITCDAVAAFTVAASGLTATINKTGSVGTLSFDYGDQTPAGTATTHIYAAGGTYTITLTATGINGCTDTATQTITVQGPCDAVAKLSIVTIDNLQVTLDTPGAVGSILFDYGDGTSGAGYVHTYSAAGTYVITVTATGANGCTNTVTQSVTVSTASGEPDGDGDCNNIVDIYDALLAAIIDAGNPDNVTVCDEAMLDVDQNGVVDINDALAIAKYDVGLNCNCVLDAKK